MILFLNGWSTCTCLCTRLTIQKPNQYIGILRWRPFWSFLNDPLFRFRMAFEYRTIQHSNFFRPFKIQTCSVFKPPLYCFVQCLIYFCSRKRKQVKPGPVRHPRSFLGPAGRLLEREQPVRGHHLPPLPRHVQH